MTAKLYVLRDGKLVEKDTARLLQFPGSANFPRPNVSRFEAMESPVTGEQITSWAQRERDMQAVNSFDARDLPKGHVFSRGIDAQKKEMSDARQREPDTPIWRDA